MTFKSPESFEIDKENIYIRAQREMTNLYVVEVQKVLTWFRDKFPKRHLRWVDGMGSHFWVLDDEIVDFDYVNKRPLNRSERLLKPLVDFYISITDDTFAPECGVQVGEWEIDRVSKEIVPC
jgi:hypothetical protein